MLHNLTASSGVGFGNIVLSCACRMAFAERGCGGVVLMSLFLLLAMSWLGCVSKSMRRPSFIAKVWLAYGTWSNCCCL